MVLYYSFKTVFAYKTKNHGLRIREDAFKGHWGDDTVGHIKQITISNNNYTLSEKEVFIFNMEDQFKRTILEMAKDITFRGLNVSTKRDAGES